MQSASASGSTAARGSSPAGWLGWLRESRAAGLEREAALLRYALRGEPFSVADTQVGDGGPHDAVHHVSVGTGGRHLVLLHGYASGAASFWRNFRGLAGTCTVHAVDWRGAGLSGRPPFTPRDGPEAVRWQVEGLEAWRAKNGVERFTLLGHSMGGILAAHYARAHPQRVEHLVLCGPAGMALPPGAGPRRPRGGTLVQIARWAWQAGVTPCGVVRWAGPWGYPMVHGYISRRFRDGEPLEEEEAHLVAPYAYSVWKLPGCAERMLNLLLAPFAQPRDPISPILEQLDAPVTFVYGSNDWMDPAHGRACVERRRASGKPAAIHMVDAAGHYAFVDQPSKVNSIVLRAVASLDAAAGAPAGAAAQRS